MNVCSYIKSALSFLPESKPFLCCELLQRNTLFPDCAFHSPVRHRSPHRFARYCGEAWHGRSWMDLVCQVRTSYHGTLPTRHMSVVTFWMDHYNAIAMLIWAELVRLQPFNWSNVIRSALLDCQNGQTLLNGVPSSRREQNQEIRVRYGQEDSVHCWWHPDASLTSPPPSAAASHCLSDQLGHLMEAS